MEDKPKMDLAQWLRQRCQKEGLSLREAAQKAGLSHSTIRDVINGSCIPSPVTIRKLAGAFSDGHHSAAVLEDTLLIMAGHLSEREGRENSEPVARLLDIISDFSEPQLKVMTRFADFLADMEAGK